MGFGRSPILIMETEKFRKAMKLLFGTEADRELFKSLVVGKMNNENRSDLFFFENACRILVHKADKADHSRIENEWFDGVPNFISMFTWQSNSRKDWADKFLKEIKNGKESERKVKTSRIRRSSK